LERRHRNASGKHCTRHAPNGFVAEEESEQDNQAITNTCRWQRAAERLGWSGRGLHRVQKLARTIADMAGNEHIGAPHVAEAMQWRRGLPAAAGR